jgi:UDP-N-acetylmuramate: L-alanyl-gamma-D-glutamyl-meso-diaminopimelate ligase
MAPLACLLHEDGHVVTGVDAHLYPPMSTLLEEAQVPVRLGFDPAAVPHDVDRVVIGNAVPRTNPEVKEVIRRGQAFLAQAETVAHYVLAPGRRAAVVAGTHGKTTTSALLSWILEAANTDPTCLVGGLLKWSRRAHRLGRGPWAVLEGDEYNTAFFDRGPKFLHYRPELFILGPVEFDHADLYRDLDAVVTAFRAGAAQVPGHGAVVVNGWCDTARAVAATAPAPVVIAGPSGGDEVCLHRAHPQSDGMVLSLEIAGHPTTLLLPLSGVHNAHNACLAAAAAWRTGVSREDIASALETFPGVARRLDVIGEAGGVVVVDDFAHHPTALAVTVTAARERWRGRRLVVAYEPRSISASRRGFQDAYVQALAGADLVLLARPFHADRAAAEDLLDREEMAVSLDHLGVLCLTPDIGADPAESLIGHLVPGDVVLGCSSGDFQNFHVRLLELLGGPCADA